MGAATDDATSELMFREDNESIEESLRTLRRFTDRGSLVRYCRLRYRGIYEVTSASLIIHETPHFDRRDERTGWDKTFLVMIEGVVVGYTNKRC